MKLDEVRLVVRWLLGLTLMGAGVAHFVFADFFFEIMPEWIPLHALCVYLSGAIEIALGVGLQLPKLQRLSAWGIVALLVAVFPVNINMALAGQTHIDALPEALQPTQLSLWLRLPMQFVMGFMAYWLTRPASPEAKAGT